MSAFSLAWNSVGLLVRPGIEMAARWSGDPEWPARAGIVSKFPEGALWLHASSVGELGAVEPLRLALKAGGLDAGLRITCQTRTGLRHARERLGAAADLAPLDARFAVSRRIRRTRPSGLIILETEIWPATLEEAHSRALPVSWVNARLSAERFHRLLRWRRWLAPLLCRVRAVATQTAGDAERFEALGVPAGVLQAVGNLKHDRPDAPALDRAAAGLPAAGPVVVLGSVREPEESMVIEALQVLLGSRSEPAIVIAPRHPERFEAVAAGLLAAGVGFSRRSRGGVPERTLLLDTLGELGSYYMHAEVSFVGGSLVPLGGHDVMEPARAGSPVLFGPHTSHCGSDPGELLAAGAACVVNDGPGLAASVVHWLENPTERARAARAALEAASRAQGAAPRAVAWLVACGALAGVKSALLSGEVQHRS